MSLTKLRQWVECWLEPVTRVMDWIASAVLFLMMLLTITDVVLRKIASRSILGTVEITEFMLVIVIFFAMARTEIFDGHVKVDLVMNLFSSRIQGFVDMLTQSVCFVLTVLIAWSSVLYAAKMRASGEVSQDLWLPVHPFIYLVAFGCAVYAFALIVKFIVSLTKAVEK